MSETVLEWIREYVHRRFDHLHTPGLALAVTDRERCLGQVLEGFADVGARVPVSAHHLFQIGSISKGFTALAVLQQAEAGAIDTGAPVTTYLPWFEVRSSFGPISIHHLLSHTSGLVAGTDSTGAAAAEAWSLRETEAGFAPGERFLYSNAGYKVLGLVLEAVTGRPWWETVRDRVMEPIGMAEADAVITNGTRERLAVGYTSPFDDRPWLPRHGWAPSVWFESATADGTICATAEELTAYARLLLAGGAGVVSAASFERMTTPVAADPETGDRYGYGVKWTDQDGVALLGHSGGMIGFSSYLLVDPESGFGAVVLSNSAFGRTRELAGFALACVRAEAGDGAPPEIPDPPDPARVADAEAYAGVYDGEAVDVVIEAGAERLTLRTGGRAARLVTTDEPDTFLVDDPWLDRHAIRFLREEGIVTGAFWGPEWLRTGRSAETVEPEHPAEWEASTGRYASWNPWLAGFRVFLRRGVLWLGPTGDASDVDGERVLTPLPGGTFRVGAEWSPDRVRFDQMVDGKAQRAVFDAAPFYRTFAP